MNGLSWQDRYSSNNSQVGGATRLSCSATNCSSTTAGISPLSFRISTMNFCNQCGAERSNLRIPPGDLLPRHVSVTPAGPSTMRIHASSWVASLNMRDGSCCAGALSSHDGDSGRYRRDSWRTAKPCSRPLRLRIRRKKRWRTWRLARSSPSSTCCTPSRCTSSFAPHYGRRSSEPVPKAWRRSCFVPRTFLGRNIAFPSTDYTLRRYLEDRADGCRSRLPLLPKPTGARPNKGRSSDSRLLGDSPLMTAEHGTISRSIRWPPPLRARPPEQLLLGKRMTFVVTENCIKCKYMDCVEVCPVDCFHEGRTSSPSIRMSASTAPCASSPNARSRPFSPRKNCPQGQGNAFQAAPTPNWPRSGRSSPRRRMRLRTPRNGKASRISSSFLER